MFGGNQDFFSWPIVEVLRPQLQLANLPPRVPTYFLSENSAEEKLHQLVDQQAAQSAVTEKRYESKLGCKICTVKALNDVEISINRKLIKRPVTCHYFMN
jgi:hypothetical protein